MNDLTSTVDKWLDEPIGFLEKEILPEEKLSVALQTMYDARWLDGIKPENIISEHEFLTHFNISQ